jgi:DNA-binding NarL/FixJ family response regulator
LAALITMKLSNKPIKFAVVDDHPLFRRGIIDWLTDQPPLECCGEAANSAETLNLIRTQHLDLLLMDMRLGNEDGLELIKQIRSEAPLVKILVVSASEELTSAERAITAGAYGYILKHENIDLFLTAIDCAIKGELFVSHTLAVRLVQHRIANFPVGKSNSVQRLSDRELQVFRLLGAGLLTKEIASQMHLSGKTVETYREHIKSKLGLSNVIELVQAARLWVKSGRLE